MTKRAADPGVYFIGVKDGRGRSAGDKCLSEWPSPGGSGRQGRVFFNPARRQRPTPLTGRHAGRPLFVLYHVRDDGSPGVMTGHTALCVLCCESVPRSLRRINRFLPDIFEAGADVLFILVALFF